MNDRSGREALKCALTPKTRRQEGSPLNKVWLRLTSPYMLTFTQDASSHIGGRSTSPDTSHAKQRCSSKRAATLPEGKMGKGEGRADPTLASTTTCSAAENAWTDASDSPSTANPGARGAAVGVFSGPLVDPPHWMWRWGG